MKLGIVSQVIQNPGDVIFIPHDWWHATRSLADSIAISQEFCTLCHSDMRFHPIGLVLYGGKDSYRRFGQFNTYVNSKQPSKAEKLASVDKGIPVFL